MKKGEVQVRVKLQNALLRKTAWSRKICRSTPLYYRLSLHEIQWNNSQFLPIYAKCQLFVTALARAKKPSNSARRRAVSFRDA